MAFEETIVWTALPNGTGTDGTGNPVLKLSVHVSPRLTTTSFADATLGDYPDFSNWPSQAQSFSATLEILPPAAGAGTYTEVATITPDPRRNDIWNALFPSGMLV